MKHILFLFLLIPSVIFSQRVAPDTPVSLSKDQTYKLNSYSLGFSSSSGNGIILKGTKKTIPTDILFLVKGTDSVIRESDTATLYSSIRTTIDTKDTLNQLLTDGATITFNATLGQSARVTLGGNRTLSITNMSNGMYLTLLIIQDGTGTRTLTLPSCKVIGGGAGAVTLTTTAAAQDILSFWKINNILYCNYGKNYN